MTLPVFKKSGGSNALDVDATAGFVRALGFAGPATDGSDAIAVTIPVTQAGRVVRKWVPSSRNLAVTDFDGSWLTSSSSGATIITLIPMALLAISRNATTPVEWQFRVDIGGTGALFVTPSTYRGQVASSAAMVALNSPTPAIGDWCQRTDVTTGGYSAGQIFMLASGSAGTAGNWIAQTGTNRPRVAWGAVADQTAMIALSGAVPGDWCTRTDATGTAYKLVASPFSTAANWQAQSGTTVAGIIVNDPKGLDVSTGSQFGGPWTYTTCGPAGDEWMVS